MGPNLGLELNAGKAEPVTFFDGTPGWATTARLWSKGSSGCRATLEHCASFVTAFMDKAMRHPKDTRTDAQKKSLLTLIRTYKDRYPGIIIRGHRDWSPDLDGDGKVEPSEWKKACPSFDVAAWLKETGE